MAAKETDVDLNIESLKLIIQSQMVLADLQRNQHRLEELIQDLERVAEDPEDESR